MTEIDFYYGLGSRYSYLAFTQLERIEKTYDACFQLKPLSSKELLGLLGQSPFEGAPISGQYVWSYREQDALDWAEYYGVPFVEPATLPDDHRLWARACWAADSQGRLRQYSERLFNAVFVERQVVDQNACKTLARLLDLDLFEFEQCLVSTTVDNHVTTIAKEAVTRRVFGVPSFLIGERLFWGNDRLVLLERHLGNMRAR